MNLHLHASEHGGYWVVGSGFPGYYPWVCNVDDYDDGASAYFWSQDIPMKKLFINKDITGVDQIDGYSKLHKYWHLLVHF